MPVSHIGLTVSHLPTSCSFFLSALQPLGYRFIGQWGNQIGLGVSDADFFLTQETPGVKAGAAHVAFAAPSRTVVREFYANALQAGGRPHGSPATRTEGDPCFNAAVLDVDGNSVEVVFHEDCAGDGAESYTGGSRVLGWRQDVTPKLGDNKSVVSMATATNVAKKALMPASSVVSSRMKAPSVAPSVARSTSKSSLKSRAEAPPIARSFTAPTLTPQKSDDKFEISRKTLAGTILGAAAGAAIAYAMCKSEEDSAKAEKSASAYLAPPSAEAIQAKVQAQAQQMLQHQQVFQQQILQHQQILEAAPVYSSSPRSVRNASELESYYEDGYQVRQIEAAPQTVVSGYQPSGYQHPSYTTVVTAAQQAEYVPAPKSRASSSRSVSEQGGRAPQKSTASSFVPSEAHREAPSEYRSAHSQAPRSQASHSPSSHSQAPRSQASHSPSSHSQVPRSQASHSPSSHSQAPRSQASHSPSSHSQASKSHHSKAPKSSVSSKHSKSSRRDRSRSRHRSSSRSPTQSLDRILEADVSRSSASKSKKGATSVLGRSTVDYDYPSSSDRESTDDNDTVAPSDSISNAGSSSRRPHRPHHTSSHHSTASSRRDDSRRASEDGASVASGKSKRKGSVASHRSRRDSKDVMRPDGFSDAGRSESTMTPGKYATQALGKDSGMGNGSVMSMPIRGITPSMVQGSGPDRSVVSYYG